jgi:hypothetical protein
MSRRDATFVVVVVVVVVFVAVRKTQAAVMPHFRRYRRVRRPSSCRGAMPRRRCRRRTMYSQRGN